jgi:hypothetical protein
MDERQATRDLDLVRDLVSRTHRRIDVHAYQFIWWGTIVLLWYPFANVMPSLWGVTMAVALGLGIVGSTFLGWRNSRRPRLAAENTHISRQIVRIVMLSIGAGSVLSVALPTAGFVDPRHMPTVWALVYAVMTSMVGVVYTREWSASGLAIFVAAVVAMYLPDYNGLIVGPAMGLGLIVPGIVAERRVARMRRDDEQCAGDAESEADEAALGA